MASGSGGRQRNTVLVEETIHQPFTGAATEERGRPWIGNSFMLCRMSPPSVGGRGRDEYEYEQEGPPRTHEEREERKRKDRECVSVFRHWHVLPPTLEAYIRGVVGVVETVVGRRLVRFQIVPPRVRLRTCVRHSRQTRREACRRAAMVMQNTTNIYPVPIPPPVLLDGKDGA